MTFFTSLQLAHEPKLISPFWQHILICIGVVFRLLQVYIFFSFHRGGRGDYEFWKVEKKYDLFSRKKAEIRRKRKGKFMLNVGRKKSSGEKISISHFVIIYTPGLLLLQNLDKSISSWDLEPWKRFISKLGRSDCIVL